MKYIHILKLVILIGLATAMLFFTPKTVKSQIQVTVDGISYICFDNYIDNGLIFLGDCHGTISEISVTESYTPWDGGGGGSFSSNEPWNDPGGSGGESSWGSSSDGGGTNTGTTGTGDNNTHEDNLLCPCCGSSFHTDCECEVQVIDPYNITFHDKIKRQAYSEWTTNRFEKVIQRTLVGIIVDFVVGIFDAFIDEYFYDGGSTKPNYLIQHRVDVDYVMSYNWSGRVNVLIKNQHRISSVAKYSSNFKENRQYGKALYSQAIFDISINQKILNLWKGTVGFSGSLDNLRCGEPGIGQYLFFSCNP